MTVRVSQDTASARPAHRATLQVRVAPLAIWLVLGVLLVAGSMVSENFLRTANLVNVLRQAAPVGIAAVGVTLVMIMGEVDLSVGALVSLAAVICAAVMNGDAANLVPALLASCATTTVFGIVNGFLVAHTRVSSFILTLGVGMTLYGLTQMLTGGTAHGAVSPGYREFFNGRIAGEIPVLVIGFALCAAVGLAVQRLSVFGRRLYLVGANRASARLAGLPIARTVIAAYAVSGLFAGLAGLALVARSGVSGSLAASGYEFDVLAAVVLGGTAFEGGRGGIGGTLAGVLILFLAFNLVNIAGLNYHGQLIVKGAIIIIASAAYRRLDPSRRA
ncbi:MAG: ABC transporter permease [Pseudomonadota bacterium]